MEGTVRNYLGVLCIFSIGIWFSYGSEIGNSDLEETNHASKLGESLKNCNVSSDCDIENSICVKNQCQCPLGFIASANMTSCLLVATTYGDKCKEDLQCSRYLLTGGVCKDNICVCGPNYHYRHGRCYLTKGLHEECRNNDDCYVHADHDAVSCIDGYCQCSKGFYQREYRTCRRSGLEGDECTINLDCKFPNATCNNKSFKCERSNNIVLRDDIFMPQGKDRYTGNVSVDANVTIGSSCVDTTDCESIPNSICGGSKTCICNRGYFGDVESTVCNKELGEPCSPEETPVIAQSVCRNGIWGCSANTAPMKNNRECVKALRSYGFSCTRDESCYIFGPDNSCETKKCICRENSHYIEEEMFCWQNKKVGDSCFDHRDCYEEGLESTLFCRNSTCSCPEGFQINSNRTRCIPDHSNLGEFCEQTESCIAENSECVNNVCTCQESYFQLDESCVKGNGAVCNSTEECENVNNSTCESGVCTCDENSVVYSTNSCLPTRIYGGICEEDIQCAAVTENAVCELGYIFSNGETAKVFKSCQCPGNFHYRFGKCFKSKALMENCENLGECYLANDIDLAVCFNGKCHCKEGSVALGKTACISGAEGVTFATILLLVSFYLLIPTE